MESSISKDLAILAIGVVAGLSLWLLDKLGVEVPKPLAMFLLVVCLILVCWAISSLGLLERMIPGLRDKTITASSSIIACAGLCALLFAIYVVIKPTSEADFSKYKKELVMGRKFGPAEKVVLDGKSFVKCTFDRSALVYNGTAPFDLVDNQFLAPLSVGSDKDSIRDAFHFVQELNKMEVEFKEQHVKQQPKQ